MSVGLALVEGQRKRSEIHLRLGILVLGPKQRNQIVDTADFPFHMIDQRNARRDVALCGVPALQREVTGEYFALESRADTLGGADPPRHDTVAEKTFPTVEQVEHGRLIARLPV